MPLYQDSPASRGPDDGGGQAAARHPPSLADRLAKLHADNGHKIRIAAELRRRGYGRHADRLDLCGRLVRYDLASDTTRLQAITLCHMPLLCATCARRRASRLLTRWSERVQWLDSQHAYHVTMTIKSRETFKPAWDHLRASINRYLSKPKLYPTGRRWVSGVTSYEVTHNVNGWHPHTHGLWCASIAPDVDKMRNDWRCATIDSHVFRVDRIDSIAGAAREVLKYPLKFRELSALDAVTLWSSVKRTRWIHSWGSVRKVPLASTSHEHVPTYDTVTAQWTEEGWTVLE